MTMYLILSDLQIPYQDDDAFETFLAHGSQLNPDIVIVIGDFVDCPSISTFCKGTAGEYVQTLGEEMAKGRSYLERLRRQFNGLPIYFHVGNHEARISRYVTKWAPALAGLTDLRIESLLDLERLDIRVADKYHVHEGAFVTTHGHFGSLKRVAGMTALKSAESIGLPVVCGHTHRLGIVYSTAGVSYLGTRNTVWGMEVGHMMDMSQVHYVKSDVLNWQTGFGFVDVTSGIARPFVIEIPR